jgi:hypothetical protein
MLDVMLRIGTATRQNMPCVQRDERTYLVMDNARGHGTEAAIQQYTQDLLVQF